MSGCCLNTVVMINDVEKDAVVKFDYQPEESSSMDGPGCKEDAEITEILIDGEPLPPWLVKILEKEIDVVALLESIATENELDYLVSDLGY